MSKANKKHQWGWFIGLYLLGFASLTLCGYLLKGLISFL